MYDPSTQLSLMTMSTMPGGQSIELGRMNTAQKLKDLAAKGPGYTITIKGVKFVFLYLKDADDVLTRKVGFEKFE